MSNDEYPESEKVLAIPEAEKYAITHFLEWLQRHNYDICQWRDAGDNGEPRTVPATEEQLEEIRKEWGRFSWYYADAEKNGFHNAEFESWDDGFYPVRKGGIEGWLAAYYEIDLKAYHAERERAFQVVAATTREVLKQKIEETDHEDSSDGNIPGHPGL